LIETAIINNSPDTLFYISMSCSWQVFYRADSKEFFIETEPCYKNGFLIIKVPPYQSIKKILTIKQNKLFHQLPISKIRIGFDLIKLKSKIAVTFLHSFTGNIIWSEPIELKHFY
jgi:hypothetical protein